MESNVNLEKSIQEAVAKAIASQMKLHGTALEKRISDSLQIFTNQITEVNQKMEKMRMDQEKIEKKINSFDGKINNLWKEHSKIEKEHEALLKEVKESQRRNEVAQQRIDDLEQYGRKTMVELNGFPRLANENPLNLTLELAKSINVPLCPDEIEACHRLQVS